MANTKKQAPKKSMFDAPVRGTQYSKNTKIKQNKDGTITLIEPNKKKK